MKKLDYKGIVLMFIAMFTLASCGGDDEDGGNSKGAQSYSSKHITNIVELFNNPNLNDYEYSLIYSKDQLVGITRTAIGASHKTRTWRYDWSDSKFMPNDYNYSDDLLVINSKQQKYDYSFKDSLIYDQNRYWIGYKNRENTWSDGNLIYGRIKNQETDYTATLSVSYTNLPWKGKLYHPAINGLLLSVSDFSRMETWSIYILGAYGFLGKMPKNLPHIIEWNILKSNSSIKLVFEYEYTLNEEGLVSSITQKLSGYFQSETVWTFTWDD